MLSKIVIYQSIDSFLYLPTYLSRDMEIFNTLLSSPDKCEIKIVNANGDKKAINLMLKYNLEKTDNSIAIAICDPLSILSITQKWITNIDNCRVIGSIIDKLPFWVVDHDLDEVKIRKNIPKNEYKKVIYYNDKFVTGNYLGKELLKHVIIDEEDREPVFFRDEWDKLSKFNDGKNGNKAIAITADIVNLAKGMQLGDEKKIIIKYRFSNEGAFLTTGIITTKAVCEGYPEELSKFVESIQKSISILYSSTKTAERICQDIVDQGTIKENISKGDIDEIIKLINTEKFYPSVLYISKKCWKNAMLAFAQSENWNKTDLNKNKQSFSKYVDNQFVRKSEKRIASQFGITVETFKISKYVKWFAILISYPVKLLELIFYWLFNLSIKTYAISFWTLAVFTFIVYQTSPDTSVLKSICLYLQFVFVVLGSAIPLFQKDKR